MSFNSRNSKAYLQIAAIASLLCVGASPVVAAQNQRNRPPDDQGEYAPPEQYGTSGQYAQEQDPQGPPPYQQSPPPYRQGQPPYQSQQGQQSYQVVPPTLTLPAGTIITVRTSQWLTSNHSHVGEPFDAVLARPVIVDGWVVARPGQTVLGRVAVAENAKHGSDVSRLGLELTDLTLVDGQQVPLRTQLVQSSGGTAYGRDAGTIAATTITGAAIGGAVGRGEGAGIGAAAGALAGIIGVMVTPGKPTAIPPEAALTFRQESALNISTVRSAQAFQPVSEEDYPSRGSEPRNYGPQRMAGGPAPAPPPPDYSYYGGYDPYAYGGSFAWGPYWGFGYGYYGPRVFVGGFRGGYRGGFRGGYRGGRGGFRR